MNEINYLSYIYYNKNCCIYISFSDSLPVPSGVVNTAGGLFALSWPSIVVITEHSYDVPGSTP